jgi:molybdopterin-guanine dinucleotide biosynthesis protein A
MTEIIGATDASIRDDMKIPMPAAVLAGGASRRMGRPKASLAYGAGTLLEYQTNRLAELFEEVLAVVKGAPESPVGRARVVCDAVPEHAAIFGLVRAMEEAVDRIFVLAVDLPAIPPLLIRAIAERGRTTAAPALVPRADGRLQPLAAVWRRAALETARRRVASRDLSLQGLAQELNAEIFDEPEWRSLDPSGTAFANLNTLEDYAFLRERA